MEAYSLPNTHKWKMEATILSKDGGLKMEKHYLALQNESAFSVIE